MNLRRTLITLLILLPTATLAEQPEKRPTSKEYAAQVISNKEVSIMNLIDAVNEKEDEIEKLKEELKKYKANSWLP